LSKAPQNDKFGIRSDKLSTGREGKTVTRAFSRDVSPAAEPNVLEKLGKPLARFVIRRNICQVRRGYPTFEITINEEIASWIAI